MREVNKSTADFIIVGGDLNSVPESQEYSELTKDGSLTNAMAEVYPANWTEAQFSTYNHPDNTYSSPTAPTEILDYIFHGSDDDGTTTTATACQLPFLTAAEGEWGVSVSDHQALACQLQLVTGDP